MYNAYPSVASTSLSASGTIAEDFTPLWVYSNGTASIAGVNGGFLSKGATTVNTSTVQSQNKLHTLNANWSASQKFAFEASIYSSVNGNTVYASIYDVTAGGTGTQVSSSQISTTANTATILRSGSFTLTPGHIYAVYLNCGTSTTAYLTKAHLVALEM